MVVIDLHVSSCRLSALWDFVHCFIAVELAPNPMSGTWHALKKHVFNESVSAPWGIPPHASLMDVKGPDILPKEYGFANVKYVLICIGRDSVGIWTGTVTHLLLLIRQSSWPPFLSFPSEHRRQRATSAAWASSCCCMWQVLGHRLGDQPRRTGHEF